MSLSVNNALWNQGLKWTLDKIQMLVKMDGNEYNNEWAYGLE